MDNKKNVRDLIYFDIDKALSLWSQIQEGLLKEFLVSEEESEKDSKGGSIGLPNIFKLNKQIEENKKASILETIIIHHDLLNRLEKDLQTYNLIIDVNKEFYRNKKNPDKIREIIKKVPYIQVNGWTVLEDYRKISRITSEFNEITKFINLCNENTLKNTQQYKQIEGSINDIEEELKTIKDRNKRSIHGQKINSLKKELNKFIETNTQRADTIDGWLQDGIKKWIEVFLKNRIIFRIYPFESSPSFQVLCNLKSECFIDQEVEHFFRSYGFRPNIKLSAFGLVTSIPSKNEILFNPLQEFKNVQILSKKMKFESAFRKVFQAMDDIEDFSKYSRYPNVTIYPIAIYRDFKCNSKHNDSK